MNVVICIIARTTSTRLPLKVLRGFNKDFSKSMLDMIIEKSKLSRMSKKIVLCTSDESCDDIMEDIALRNEIDIYRGEAEEVICRLLNVAESERADYVVRITGDNAFVSAEYIDDQISFCVENELDYCRLSGVPIGATAEVIKASALRDVSNRIDPSLSEYLMLYIFDPERYKCGLLLSSQDYSDYGVTIDTIEDLDNARKIVSILGESPQNLSLQRICSLFTTHKNLFKPISLDAEVKMPNGNKITFSQFKQDQNNRIGRVFCKKRIEDL